MQNRYKITLSNKKLYKVVEIPPDIQKMSIGTALSSDIRLRKELFFEQFELIYKYEREQWQLYCSSNIYITTGDVRKLTVKPLNHGDEIIVKYQNSDNELMRFSFILDFDYDKKAYDRVIDISGSEEINIGGTDTCQIYIDSPFIGNDSVKLIRKGNLYRIYENASKYGVYINGKRSNDTEVKSNDYIAIAGYSFYIKDNHLYTDKKSNIEIRGLSYNDISESKNQYIYPRFNRSTRMKSLISEEKITILDPPAIPTKPSGNIVLRLLPALAMLFITVVLRGFMNSSSGTYILISASTMSIGIITSTLSIITERNKYKKEVEEREIKYKDYIDSKKKQIEEYRKTEAEQLDNKYYSIENEIQLVNDFSSDLFNRNITDDDYLEIRIGTGKKRTLQPIEYKKQEKLEANDKLSNLPNIIAIDNEFLDNAPVTVNLHNYNAIGIVGKRSYLYEMLKNITLDLSIRHYYSDVKLFFIINEDRKSQFHWLRLLPHVNNENLGMRNIVCDTDSKNILFEYLYKEISHREAEKIVYPSIVVFIYDDMGIQRHPISRFINDAKKFGITFIFFAEHFELLPNGCNDVIYLDTSSESGFILNSSNSTNKQFFTYKSVPDKITEMVVNRLAPIYCDEISLEGSLTKSITLFELLKIMNADDINLSQNWAKSEVYRSMAAPLGVKAKNEVVYLDLNEKYHGPHGLVAGTTGSGKSEILQSYILSMATLFHPYEVGFVIIDFKGGGMVNQFKNLPHLVGAITNIDGREINRSLLSIKAELRKRQELFALHEVNHIDAYIKKYKKGEAKIPLPHLILIVDEFAELKMDQPEFMKELISAARIGRSLGVHLILATQKPSGVVDSQIWSNSKFKLCLKVQNKEDSNEVIKTPLAAEIKEPGRAYLQVGNNEIFELFQSAYSGGPATIDDSDSQLSFNIYKVEFSGKKSQIYSKRPEKSMEERETQLSSIVKYIDEYCEKAAIQRLRGICLPPLAERIEYSAASKRYDKIQTIIPLGIYDDPDNQDQDEVVLDILSGNTMIIGSSQYGKTNLVQNMIRGVAENYKPDEVSIFILDFGSMSLKTFNSLNHVGGVIVASEDEKMKNFIRMIMKEIKYRKEKYSKIGVTSFSSYKEAGNKDISHIIVIIDNFIAFKELYPEYEEDMINLCREGVALGISIVITSLQTNGISYKYMSNFSNRICLYCNQGDEYGSIFDKCRMEPKNVPGRGLISINKNVYEFQTYLAFEGDKEIDRVNKIREFIAFVNSKNLNLHAYRIPEVPQVLDLKYVDENIRSMMLKAYQVPIGVDYDTIEFIILDLLKTVTIGITGREGYGKTNLFALIMQYLYKNVFDLPSKVYILDDYEKQLSKYEEYGIVESYSVIINDFETYIIEIEEELQIRNKLVQEDGIKILDNLPLIIFAIQNKNIFSAEGISKTALESYKRVIKNYKHLKICFIFTNIENVPIAYAATEMLKMVKEYNSLFLMDELSNLKLIDVNAATLRQYKKPIQLGDAYLITEKGIRKHKVIHTKEDF